MYAMVEKGRSHFGRIVPAIAGRRKMGLRTKFNLSILVAFAVGFGIAAIVLRGVFIDNANDQVMQNAAS
jgi:hypothetical protein